MTDRVPLSMIFRYSAAATAGYAVTLPIVNWLMRGLLVLLKIAGISFALGVVIAGLWLGSRDPAWLPILGICCIILGMTLIPLVIGGALVSWIVEREAARHELSR